MRRLAFFANHSHIINYLALCLYFFNSASPSPISVINKTIDEDRFDIPDVPMEED